MVLTRGPQGAILVFMPGLMEIKKVIEACSGNSYIQKATGDGQYLIGLHSALSTAEQRVIFERPPQVSTFIPPIQLNPYTQLIVLHLAPSRMLSGPLNSFLRSTTPLHVPQ
jgi:hypothetical protein